MTARFEESDTQVGDPAMCLYCSHSSQYRCPAHLRFHGEGPSRSTMARVKLKEYHLLVLLVTFCRALRKLGTYSACLVAAVVLLGLTGRRFVVCRMPCHVAFFATTVAAFSSVLSCTMSREMPEFQTLRASCGCHFFAYSADDSADMYFALF